MKRILLIILSTIIAGTNLSGCSMRNEMPDNGKINIVATIFPEYDFARAIAGDKANIEMLIRTGASLHSYEPSPGDIIRIQKADVFIYIGGESDSWVKDHILASLDTSEMKIIRLMDYIDEHEEEMEEGTQADDLKELNHNDDQYEDRHHDDGHDDDHSDDGHHDDGHDDDHSDDGHHDDSHDDDHSDDVLHEDELEYDEHIWTSPKNAIKLIDVICEGICEKDSENAEFYRANATKYRNELISVDKQITEIVENAKRKKIVVADKFPFLYFVNHYGLEYEAALPGCSNHTDVGARTLKNLVNAVKSEEIPYIYYVELSNRNVASAVSEETGAEMLLLNSCHNVGSTDFNNGVTYLSLMQENIENLRKGLN